MRGKIFFLSLISSATFAGTMGDTCSQLNITTACNLPNYMFSAEAVYLRPGFNITPKVSEQNGNATANKIITPGWGWGAYLEGAMYFEGASDLDLNMYIYDYITKSTATILVSNSTSAGTTGFFGTAYSNNKTVWIPINGEFGKTIDLPPRTKVRLHAGAQYLYLSSADNVNYVVPGFPDATYPQKSGIIDRFNAGGPRIGAQFSHDFNWLTGYINGAAALLIGVNNNDDTFVIPRFYTSNATKKVKINTTIMSPEVESKIGVRKGFTYQQNNFAFDIGYLWINYFNVLPNVNPVDTGSLSNIKANGSGINFNGLYFGLHWLGY